MQSNFTLVNVRGDGNCLIYAINYNNGKEPIWFKNPNINEDPSVEYVAFEPAQRVRREIFTFMQRRYKDEMKRIIDAHKDNYPSGIQYFSLANNSESLGMEVVYGISQKLERRINVYVKHNNTFRMLESFGSGPNPINIYYDGGHYQACKIACKEALSNTDDLKNLNEQASLLLAYQFQQEEEMCASDRKLALELVGQF